MKIRKMSSRYTKDLNLLMEMVTMSLYRLHTSTHTPTPPCPPPHTQTHNHAQSCSFLWKTQPVKDVHMYFSVIGFFFHNYIWNKHQWSSWMTFIELTCTGRIHAPLMFFTFCYVNTKNVYAFHGHSSF